MNKKKFKSKCLEKDVKFIDISKQLGIAISTFYRKLKENTFTCGEIQRIIVLLKLTHDEVMDIFFEKLSQEVLQ